jgi:hypothetical protein
MSNGKGDKPLPIGNRHQYYSNWEDINWFITDTVDSMEGNPGLLSSSEKKAKKKVKPEDKISSLDCMEGIEIDESLD